MTIINVVPTSVVEHGAAEMRLMPLTRTALGRLPALDAAHVRGGVNGAPLAVDLSGGHWTLLPLLGPHHFKSKSIIITAYIVGHAYSRYTLRLIQAFGGFMFVAFRIFLVLNSFRFSFFLSLLLVSLKSPEKSQSIPAGHTRKRRISGKKRRTCDKLNTCLVSTKLHINLLVILIKF